MRWLMASSCSCNHSAYPLSADHSPRHKRLNCDVAPAGLTTVRGLGHVHRPTDPVPRSPGAYPNGGDRSRRAVCSPRTGPDTTDDTARSQRMERRMDCTTIVHRRSSGPSPLVRFHRTLAYHSPPPHTKRSDPYPCFSTMLPTGTPKSRAMTGHFVCSRKNTRGPSSLSVS